MSALQDIIADIKNECCVLIIGPDLADHGERSFFEVFTEELLADNQYNDLLDLNPEYIFHHEELLQLKPTAKESKIWRYMRQFYEKQDQFDRPLRMISRIPFHLIVSLFPDTRINKIFDEQKLPFQYKHYPREIPPDPVKRPSKEEPLIYNMLGDLNQQDVIITFEHLFTYLEGIMGKRELPNALQDTFRRAQSFIFLGVHFERWYVQLLLRIITKNEKKEKYTILKNGGKNEICTFIARRLALDFIDTDPLHFLQELYEECGRAKLLKPVASVFISYSHNDKEEVMRIAELLRARDIVVVMDVTSMSPGQQILQFMEIIKEVDCVLAVISVNSLKSPWVSREIITTMQKTEKHFIPCVLDDTFLDKGFIAAASKTVDETLGLLDGQIGQRSRIDTQDLQSERKHWVEYLHYLPLIINELGQRKCMSLKAADLDANMPIVIEDILKNK